MESWHYDFEHCLSVPRDLEINCWMKVLQFMFASTRWSKVCLELESLHVDIATIQLLQRIVRRVKDRREKVKNIGL